MSIEARLEQPCMAYCGHLIYPGMYIEEGPKGWQHWRCPEGPPRRRTVRARVPKGSFVCWNCKRTLSLSEHAIGEEFKRCRECHEKIQAERTNS